MPLFQLQNDNIAIAILKAKLTVHLQLEPRLDCNTGRINTNYTDISLPAALRASASRQYLVCSEADFDVFRPAGATRCTDGGDIWHGGLIQAKFHLIGATTRV